MAIGEMRARAKKVEGSCDDAMTTAIETSEFGKDPTSPLMLIWKAFQDEAETAGLRTMSLGGRQSEMRWSTETTQILPTYLAEM